MDKQEMELAVAELRKCGEALVGVAERLAKAMGETVPEAHKETVAEAAPTLEEVRTVLAGLSRNGLTAQVRELLQKHGADRLSEVNPTEYAAILKEAESLGS